MQIHIIQDSNISTLTANVNTWLRMNSNLKIANISQTTSIEYRPNTSPASKIITTVLINYTV